MTKVFYRSKKWYGCVPDDPTPSDQHFKPTAIRLPPEVDLRPLCPPVMVQGELGSCVAHGVTEALRYLLIKGGKIDVPLSRLQLYYDARAIEGVTGEDTGCQIRDAIKSALVDGVAHEPLWPYDINRYTAKPTPDVYVDAKKFEAATFERVPIGTNAVMNALARGFPVIVGLSVFESFEGQEVADTGFVPLPDFQQEEMLGGHCMLCVGYGQQPGRFTVRNSWGADWGDQGDCYIPMDYLGSPDFGADFWIIKSTT
jgi:C1A family cysteine protease